METEETLKLIGLDENEAKIYLAALALGESTVLPIADKASVGRTYAYDILGSLAEKGLISYVEKRGRRRYSAAEPRMLKNMLKEKMNQVNSILPNLEALYQKAGPKPKVRFFQGKDGIEVLFNEVLQEAKEVRYWSSISDLAKAFPNYLEVIKKQVDKDIKIYDLVRQSPEALSYRDLYKKGRQEQRYLPENAVFSTDNMVWNNKFVMISYGADLYAVSVESAEIAKTMKVIYEILWQSAKKIWHRLCWWWYIKYMPRKTVVQALQEAHQKDLKIIQEGIGILSDKIDTVKAGQEKEFKSVKQDINILKNDVGTLNKKVVSIENKIDDLDKKVAAVLPDHEKRITRLEVKPA